MKETRAVVLLRAVSVFAAVTLVGGGILGKGVLSRSPGSIADLIAQITGGFGDGFMGAVVIAFLMAPPLAMLTVAFEGRADRPRHLWIAIATMGVLVLSAVIAALGN